MKQKLILLLSQYGNDFFHKLPRYQTARYKGEFVKLLFFHPDELTYTVRGATGKPFTVDVFDLESFVL
jgi:hypothetical protein